MYYILIKLLFAETYSSSHGHTSLPSALDVAALPLADSEATIAVGSCDEPSRTVLHPAVVVTTVSAFGVRCSTTFVFDLSILSLVVSLSTELTFITGVTPPCFLVSDSDFNRFFRCSCLVSAVDGVDDGMQTAAVADCCSCGDMNTDDDDDADGFSGDLLSGDGPMSKSSADETDGRSTVCCGVVHEDPRRDFASPPRPQLRRSRVATESD